MVEQRLKLSAKVILEDLPPPEEPEYDEFPGKTRESFCQTIITTASLHKFHWINLAIQPFIFAGVAVVLLIAAIMI